MSRHPATSVPPVPLSYRFQTPQRAHLWTPPTSPIPYHKGLHTSLYALFFLEEEWQAWTSNYELNPSQNPKIVELLYKSKLTTIIPLSHHCRFCRSLLAFDRMMTWQTIFGTNLIGVFRAITILSLWDATHFLGDNCPCNGCPMYQAPASLMRRVLMRTWRLMASKDFKCVDTTGQQDANGCSWRSKEKSHNLMRRGDATLKSPLRL